MKKIILLTIFLLSNFAFADEVSTATQDDLKQFDRSLEQTKIKTGGVQQKIEKTEQEVDKEIKKESKEVKKNHTKTSKKVASKSKKAEKKIKKPSKKNHKNKKRK